MKSVVDASFILDFLLPDEQSEYVIKTFEEYKKGQMTLMAPLILPFEIANGLKYAIKTKRINQKMALELLEIFLSLKIDLLTSDMYEVLETSLEKELSIYDAAYITLSQQENLHLLTLDEKLRKLTSRKN
jgi:predicted nucleic acid-binding protein